jgi:hypothetical protein
VNDGDGASAFAEVLRQAFVEVAGAPEPSPSANLGGRAADVDVSAAGLSFVADGRKPSWAEELGVELPCDRNDIGRAFRRLAFRVHPDRAGGSREAFLRATRRLEEGLEWLRARTPPQAVAARFRGVPGPAPSRFAIA